MKKDTFWIVALAALAWWLFFRKPPVPASAEKFDTSVAPPAPSGTLDDALKYPPGTLVDMSGKPYAPFVSSTV